MIADNNNVRGETPSTCESVPPPSPEPVERGAETDEAELDGRRLYARSMAWFLGGLGRAPEDGTGTNDER